jgi:hypothetical protein
MTITKICDECNKPIICENGKSEFVWSPWRLYHHKKIRDFCSDECFKKWIAEYFDKAKIENDQLAEFGKLTDDIVNMIVDFGKKMGYSYKEKK